MAESIVKFPVVCPQCRREVLMSLPITFAAEALIRGKTIRLHSSCHDKWWDANSLEIEQLREYLAAQWPTGQPSNPTRSSSRDDEQEPRPIDQ